MRSAVATVALLILALGLATAKGASVFTIPVLEFSSAGELSETERAFFEYGLEKDGIVAMTNVPGFKEAREECLMAIGKCYQSGALHADSTLALILPDGTKRVTLAMPKTDAEVTDYGCADLNVKLERLQDIMDSASRFFAKALDSTFNKHHAPLLMAVNNTEHSSYKTFESMIEKGDHLDHFHVYEKVTDMHLREPALETHTDQGLFVAISPALMIKEGKLVDAVDGFEIEIASNGGKLSRVHIPNDGASIIFMVGDGMQNWINRDALIKPIRPVPHRLTVNELGVARVWFGRMFFPPKDAFITSRKTTFSKLRMDSVESGARKVDFAGCSNRRHVLRDLTEVACGEQEMYCWMQCMSIEGLACSKEQIECVDSNTGKTWDPQPDAHCLTCAPTCKNNLLTSNSSICNTAIYPTNMYMSGFSGISTSIPCLIFLFQSWVLDTPVKYAFGAIGAFLIGFTVELLIMLRRETKLARHKRSRDFVRCLPDISSPNLHAVVLVLFYAVQLVLAYFAMLLAMTFASIIFSMVMLGLVCGHVSFNFQMPAAGNEACCNMNEGIPDRDMNGSGTPFTDLSSDIQGGNCCDGNGTVFNNSYQDQAARKPTPTLV